MRLVIIDDHPLYREGVVSALSGEADMTVVAEGASADDAVRLTTSLRPDILLLDLGIPGDGLTAISAISAAASTTRIVILTVAASEDMLIMAVNSGAVSYVLKGVTGRELAKIVRDAHAGRRYVPPELAANVLTGRSGGPTSRPINPLDELTERERHILAMVGDGATNLEIARALSLAEATVKNTMTTIMQKMQVRNRVEAAVLASRRTQPPVDRSSLPPLSVPLGSNRQASR